MKNDRAQEVVEVEGQGRSGGIVLTKWPDEQTAVMRGIFGNLVNEAKSLQERLFDKIGACGCCSHLFDKRDDRAELGDEVDICPACVAEHDSHQARKVLRKAESWEKQCEKMI
jgi:hypothetical protein